MWCESCQIFENRESRKAICHCTAAPTEAIRPNDYLAHRPSPLRRGARHPRHRPRLRPNRSCPTSASGSRRRRSRSSWRASSASSASSACTSRATAAPAPAPPPTASPAWSWRPATRGIRSLVSVQGSLAMFAIWRWGSEEQKQEWLPRMAAGEALGCFGLTEPDAGSDPGSMRTRAQAATAPTGSCTGRRCGSPTARVAEVAVVWAQTDEGVRGFLVPNGHQGLHHPGHPRQDARCAPRSPPSCCSTTSASRPMRSCPRSAR